MIPEIGWDIFSETHETDVKTFRKAFYRNSDIIERSSPVFLLHTTSIRYRGAFGFITKMQIKLQEYKG